MGLASNSFAVVVAERQQSQLVACLHKVLNLFFQQKIGMICPIGKIFGIQADVSRS
jgi:hypothetical protein